MTINVHELLPETDVNVVNRYAIHSLNLVHSLCQTMLDEESEIYVFLNGRDEDYFVTEILELRPEEQIMYLGTPFEKKYLSLCNNDADYYLICFPEGVKTQIHGRGMRVVDFQGASAIQMCIPDSLSRFQRRNFFRVFADPVFRAQCKLEIDSLDYRFEILDFSLAGCGLSIYEHKVAHKPGHVFENARLSLPDTDKTMLMDLVLKNVKPSTDDPNTHFYGCEILLRDPKDEALLQKFLLATERRQRAASTSAK